MCDFCPNPDVEYIIGNLGELCTNCYGDYLCIGAPNQYPKYTSGWFRVEHRRLDVKEKFYRTKT